MKKHTLFALCCRIQMDGPVRFKDYLKHNEYTEEQITAIRNDMKQIKKDGKVDYARIY